MLSSITEPGTVINASKRGPSMQAHEIDLIVQKGMCMILKGTLQGEKVSVVFGHGKNKKTMRLHYNKSSSASKRH